MSPDTPRSDALIRRLHAVPRLAPPVVALVLLLVGLMAPPLYAVPALLLLLAFIIWLASLSWHGIDGGGRLLRMLVIGVLAAGLLARVWQGIADS